MTTWFISDTHFGHQNILTYAGRPFQDPDHMNEHIVKVWNEHIMPDDIVYHLGDVAMGPWVKWDNVLSRLAGYKVLILGNHDRPFMFKGKPKFQQWWDQYLEWFHEIHWHHENIIGDYLFNLSHFPYDEDERDQDRHNKEIINAGRIEDNGVALIHGHTHSTDKITFSKKGSLQIHVGWEAWQRPVNQMEILDLVDNLAKYV